MLTGITYTVDIVESNGQAIHKVEKALADSTVGDKVGSELAEFTVDGVGAASLRSAIP